MRLFHPKKTGIGPIILQSRSRYSYSIFKKQFYEEPNLGDNMAGENNLTYSLTLLIYIQVNEYGYYSDCFSTKVNRPFIVA